MNDSDDTPPDAAIRGAIEEARDFLPRMSADELRQELSWFLDLFLESVGDYAVLIDVSRIYCETFDAIHDDFPEIAHKLDLQLERIRQVQIAGKRRPLSTGAALSVIHAQIESERSRQASTLDRHHTRNAWLRLLDEHVARLRSSACSPNVDDEWRHRMIVIAALCVSAIAAHDQRPAPKADQA